MHNKGHWWRWKEGGEGASVLQEWSLLTRNAEAEIVPTCAALGIPVVAYSPLARNLLGGLVAGRCGLPALIRMEVHLSGTVVWYGMVANPPSCLVYRRAMLLYEGLPLAFLSQLEGPGLRQSPQRTHAPNCRGMPWVPVSQFAYVPARAILDNCSPARGVYRGVVREGYHLL
jgi:hypothetical protein